MDQNDIPQEVQQQLRQHFQGGSDERGCLVTKDWKVIPFTNCVKGDAAKALIEQRLTDDVSLMVDLIEKDNLWAWAHSHPAFPASPSCTDISSHDVPCHMIIWSGVSDSFGIWTAEEIVARREEMNRTMRHLALGYRNRRELRTSFPDATVFEGFADDPGCDDNEKIGPDEIFECVNINDSEIAFTLDALTYTNAIAEALSRLGWDIVRTPVTFNK